jgi:hypothetical protein
MNYALLLMRIMLAIIFLTMIISAEISAQVNDGEPRKFLQKYLEFTRSELISLEQGQPVIKLPKTSSPQEVATFGIIRIKASNESLVAKFSREPQLEDLRGLRLDDNEILSLKNCQTGHCAVKLSEKTILHFQREVNWSSPNYHAQVDQLIRQMMIQYVSEY